MVVKVPAFEFFSFRARRSIAAFREEDLLVGGGIEVISR